MLPYMRTQPRQRAAKEMSKFVRPLTILQKQLLFRAKAGASVSMLCKATSQYHLHDAPISQRISSAKRGRHPLMHSASLCAAPAGEPDTY